MSKKITINDCSESFKAVIRDAMEVSTIPDHNGIIKAATIKPMISELEYIQLEERYNMVSKALDNAEDKLTLLMGCNYCHHAVIGQDWNTDGICRQCCHKSNFKPILAEKVYFK